MILQKWNVDKRQYEPFKTPTNNIQLFSEDMNILVDCTNCGKEMIFGDCYTSRLIHNDLGLGYPVCEACYKVENYEKNRSIKSV